MPKTKQIGPKRGEKVFYIQDRYEKEMRKKCPCGGRRGLGCCRKCHGFGTIMEIYFKHVLMPKTKIISGTTVFHPVTEQENVPGFKLEGGISIPKDMVFMSVEEADEAIIKFDKVDKERAKKKIEQRMKGNV